jgi:hypothetical protein
MTISVPDTNVTRASVYKDAGDARFEEAEFLGTSHPSGAIYLAGYLIECYLKWAVCERNQVQYLQDLSDKRIAQTLTSAQGHDVERLCTVTQYDKHFAGSPVLLRAFQVVATWSPKIRYVRRCGGKREVTQFLSAVRTLRADINTWAHK